MASQDGPRVTLHTGALIHSYGRFRLREQYLLREDGERRVSTHNQVLLALDQHEERPITVIERRLSSLPQVVHALHRWVTSERATSALISNNLQDVRQLGSVEAASADPKSGAAADEHVAQSSEPNHEAAWDEDLQQREAFAEEVHGALLELEAYYPELEEELARVADEVAAREAQEVRRQVARQQEARKWWLRPTPVNSGQEWVVVGAAVAQYGKVKVYSRATVLPTGREWRMGYSIRIEDVETRLHAPLLAAGAFGRPYTPSHDWNTTRRYLHVWLDEMRACIEAGRGALSTTDDPELVEIIKRGLEERQYQHIVVSSALQEAEAQQGNWPASTENE